jgi:hypothetical protein
MSSIQQVLNSVDLRRKIFNFKSQSIKTTAKNNYDNLLKDLEYNLDNVYEWRGDLYFADIEENIVMNFTRNEFYNALIDNECEDYFEGMAFWIIYFIKASKK